MHAFGARRVDRARLANDVVGEERRDAERLRDLELVARALEQLAGDPQLAQMASQHGDDAYARFARAEHRGQHAQGLRAIAGTDGVGQIEDAALAGGRDYLLDVVGGDLLALADVDRQTLDGVGELAELGADLVDDERDGVGREATPRALASPRTKSGSCRS